MNLTPYQSKRPHPPQPKDFSIQRLRRGISVTSPRPSRLRLFPSLPFHLHLWAATPEVVKTLSVEPRLLPIEHGRHPKQTSELNKKFEKIEGRRRNGGKLDARRHKCLVKFGRKKCLWFSGLRPHRSPGTMTHGNFPEITFSRSHPIFRCVLASV